MNNSILIQPFSKPIKRSVSIPGSKSDTNRALILASLTRGPIIINGILNSDDTKSMLSYLSQFGIEIEGNLKSQEINEALNLMRQYSPVIIILGQT